ncbi:TonB family protein [Myxococcota bacterium]|nr:TonB family protein [Myxococcota bacterium]
MYGRRLALAVILSLGVHALVPLVVPRQPPRTSAPPTRRAAPKPVAVAVVREVQRAAEEPLPAPPPRPAPPPPSQAPAPERPRKPPPPPREAPPPPAKAEPSPAPEPRAEPRKPAPFVLSNVALQGTVAVQTGTESNLFGDPSRDATGFRKEVDRPAGSGTAAADNGAPREARKPVVKPPKALNRVQGTYPEAHRDLGRVVRVELLLTVSAGGEVTEVQVRKGDLPAFDEEARRTVMRLRFEPATRDGTPIPYQVAWTVVFLPEP